MTDHEANDKLYQRMATEQDAFRKWLLNQTPEEVLNHAYEYCVREDVLISLEDTDLDGRDARALLKSPTPLADIYKEWQSRETGYMEDIRDAILDRARTVIQRENAAREQER